MASNKITSDNIVSILDICYDKAINGIPKVSKSVEELAKDYLSKNTNTKKAAKSMLNNQVAKCTTSGVVTGFGGFITLPVTLPANITSVLYVQIRMIACCAYMGGYDVKDDQVQTFVYACLAGVSIAEIGKKFGIAFGEKMAIQGIKKIPAKTLTKINQKLGFRFITKFGEKGLINLGKAIPFVGAGIGGAFDFADTRIIANRAYKMFIKKDINVGGKIDD